MYCIFFLLMVLMYGNILFLYFQESSCKRDFLFLNVYMALNLRMWIGIVGRAVISPSMETKEIRFALDITGSSTTCIYLSAYKQIHGPCDFRDQILQLLIFWFQEDYCFEPVLGHTAVDDVFKYRGSFIPKSEV